MKVISMVFRLFFSLVLVFPITAFMVNETCGSGVKSYSVQSYAEPSLLIYGNVVLEGGGEISEAVSIELVCNTQITRQVFTDRKGAFKFQFGKGTQDVAISDLSSTIPAGGGLSNQRNIQDSVNSVSPIIPNLENCEIRVAQIQGYSSDPTSTHNFEGRFPTGNIGSIVLQPIEDVRGKRLSQTSFEVPGKAQDAYFKAQELAGKKKPNFTEALAELNIATGIFPEFAAAWTLKAEIYRVQNNSAMAKDAFEKVRKINPDYVFPYLGLARISSSESNWIRTLELTSELRNMGVINPEVHYLEGISYYYQGELKTSENSFLSIDRKIASSKFPMTLLYLAIIYSVGGEIEKALDEFGSYLKAVPPDRVPQSHRQRIQDQLDEWLQKGLITQEQAALNGLG